MRALPARLEDCIVSSDTADVEGGDSAAHQSTDVDSDDAAHDSGVAVESHSDTAGGDESSEGFGRQGWLLVVGVVVCFLVIPGVVYLRPAVPAAAGLPFFASFLVLPLIPAVILGLLAVWSMRAAD